MDMEITVNEQTQKFYLAMDKWKEVVGHEIKVGEYRFCAIPFIDNINISEVTTGARILYIPVNDEMMTALVTKEGSMRYFKKTGKHLKKLIESANDFDKRLAMMGKTAFERLGKMPQVENVNTDWIFDDESEVLN